MLKIFQKLDKEKGNSVIQLMAILATASVVIGGVSVKAQDLIDYAKDTQRVANLRQISTALELYYLDNLSYPQVAGIDSQGRWNELISEIDNYLASLVPEQENYDYQDLNGGENYVLRVLLEDPESSYLATDLDGQQGNLNCQDPYYCLSI